MDTFKAIVDIVMSAVVIILLLNNFKLKIALSAAKNKIENLHKVITDLQVASLKSTMQEIRKGKQNE